MAHLKFEELTVEQANRVDELCDRFEQSWQPDQASQIEALLEETDEALRRVVVSELLSIELELRVRRGEQPSLEEYAYRFPRYRELLAETFEELPRTASVQPKAIADERPQTPPTYPLESAEIAPLAPAALHELRDYQIMIQLGAGGMGDVYKALHKRLEKFVAVKVLAIDRSRDPDAVSRFHREMKAVGKLDHPNIVRATDAGEADETLYLVMEFIDGLHLGEIVRELGVLAVADACELIRQAALGLQHAHEHGMVHRDVKPSNLMLTSPAGAYDAGPKGGLVKLLDLGLARLRDDGRRNDELTSTGQVMGTVDFMAPEQATDTRTVGIGADLYSLGCTMFYLLTKHPPFYEEGQSSLYLKFKAHVESPIPSLQDFRRDIPPELDAIVQRLLAKDPTDRYATPAEVAEVLARFAETADLRALLAYARGEQPPISARETAERGTVSPDSSDTRSEHPAFQDSPTISEMVSVDSSLVDSSLKETIPKDVSRYPSLADDHFTADDLPPTEVTISGMQTVIESTPQSATHSDAKHLRRNPRLWIAAIVISGLVFLAGRLILAPTEYGSLQFESELGTTGNLEITVDGNEIQNDEFGAPIQFEVGRHTIGFARDGLQAHTGPFDVKKDETVVVRITQLEDSVAVIQINGDDFVYIVDNESGEPRLLTPSEFRERITSPAVTPIKYDDRNVAEWVISIGGQVIVLNDSRWISTETDLPSGAFSLAEISLQENPTVKDEDLKRLSRLEKLRKLELGRTRIGDAGLEHLRSISAIQYLGLGHTLVTNKGLAHISEFSDLKHLGLSETFITDAGLVHLRGLKQLEVLGLEAIEISGDGIKHLANLTSLQHLNLATNSSSDKDLESLSNLKELIDLNLNLSHNITNDGVRYLATLTNLKVLTIMSRQLDNEGLTHFQRMEKLERLSLNHTNISDGAVQQLSKHERLNYLNLSNTVISDASAERLGKLSKLRELHIRNTKVTSEGVAIIEKSLPNCKIEWHGSTEPNRRAAEWALSLGGNVTLLIDGVYLDAFEPTDLPSAGSVVVRRISLVNVPNITDADLEILDGLEQLLSFSAYNSNLTDEALDFLPKTTALTTIGLSRSRLTDAGLAKLKSFPNLQVLSIAGTQITDEGLAQLASLKSLRSLDLDTTKISDAGLQHLKKMTQLKLLDIPQTNVTAGGVIDLQAALPNCKIISEFSAWYVANWVISKGGRIAIRGDEWISEVADLPDENVVVIKVDLSGIKTLSDERIERLAGLRHLEQLLLSESNVGDSGLAHLHKMRTLHGLYLSKTRITDKGLEHIRGNELEAVFLGETSITDDGLDLLAKQNDISRLWDLRLGKTKINGSSLERFTSSRLSYLDLSETQITDANLKSVGKFSRLETLSLHLTEITDNGLNHLTGLSKLKQLVLRRTKVTAKGVASLKEALPNCKISFDVATRE